MSAYERLNELGVTLPEPPPNGGVYMPVKGFGERFVYVSGNGPDINGKPFRKGKLGAELTVEDGQEAARCCVLNILAVIQKSIGDLDKIKRVVKILAFVASDNDFYEQPQVVNGASGLLVDILGQEVGLGARSAIGVNVLPGNVPVEIEMLLELK